MFLHCASNSFCLPLTGVKSWSSVTMGEPPKPVVGHKSPYFQDEFPSLASTGDDKGKEGDKKDSEIKEQYGPGPSLRPQSNCFHFCPKKI